ncbi:element excision factor XisH family protein [Microcoleus vaginatus]|uniref:element excision factor XisH family protein n=1 Tax=Microcoleus vaginatus TaxID=119532 RepID=UPI00403EFD1C|nr:hypothetical protein D0A37_07015 [Microcoleus vaginatus HSN003]
MPTPQKNLLFVEQAGKPVLEGRPGCPPHKRTFSLWNRPESLFLRMLQNFNLNLFYNRSLYLAICQPIFNSVFTIELSQLLLKKPLVKLIVLDEKSEAIVQWIPD